MVGSAISQMVAHARDGIEADKQVRIWAPGLDGTVVSSLEWALNDSSLLRATVTHGDEGVHYFEAGELTAVRVAEAPGYGV